MQAHTVVSSRERQWATERYGVGLSGLRQSQDGTGRMACLRTVLFGDFESYRPYYPDIITYVPCSRHMWPLQPKLTR